MNSSTPTNPYPVQYAAVDGNEAAASVAYRLTETVAIYPITPSSPMAEFCDEWSAKGNLNLWGTVPRLIEMQSEAGAAGAMHGMLAVGSMSTTFTASQGLLLMIPNMYKIAGELLPFCMHVTARTLATHALSIFGDHSDVMACRQTGFAMLASGSVQEAHDMAAIAHASTLHTRVPFLHFFDGFRTSHEVAKINMISDEILRSMFADTVDLIQNFRSASMSPDHPQIRGTAQNPDVFFQAREAANPFYDKAPATVQAQMDKFADLTGRRYHLFDYVGHPEAERVIVIMGSGGDTAEETTNWLIAKGEKVGIIKIRLYRPFSIKDFVSVLPKTTKKIAVLDRSKEPGAPGDPTYLDVITALSEAREAGLTQFNGTVIAGRFGLASKEFTPSQVKAVFDELKKDKPKNHFTVGIFDDVSHSSLPFDTEFDIEPDNVVRAVFFGLGADGTVGANKNSIKIIAEETDFNTQAYFVYDSNKSGSITISHLRFGPQPIKSAYLIKRANFVACHQWQFLDRYDVLKYAADGAVFLVNSTFAPDELFSQLNRDVQEQILAKKLKVYTIDAYNVAKAAGMGGRINTVMQTCFFALSGVLPREDAIAQIKKAIKKTYTKKGEAVVKKNYEAVDQTLASLNEVKLPTDATSDRRKPQIVPEDAPDFVKRVTAMIIGAQGDMLPVSAFPIDGTWPMATSRWEKRGIAQEIPVWDPTLCIQCNKCVAVCPHAAVRANFYPADALANAPETFKSLDFRSQEHKGSKYTIQIAPEDCTGCTLCAVVCPAKSKTDLKHKALDMSPMAPLRLQERENYKFFLSLPKPDRAKLPIDLKGSQFMEPLFEYSGACAGCGETQYIKLLTQLYGDRLVVANATGCSSIYGGNLPTTPYTVDNNGRGPAWSNSLFEDNAEYGLGQRLGIDKQTEIARELLGQIAGQIGDAFVSELLNAKQVTEADLAAQRVRVVELRKKLKAIGTPLASRLDNLADYLVKKSVWIVGGDGWAYDIGFGGLDHVIAMNRDVNILVLDTQVYSNTGGQQSKSTPPGAAAKFAVAGKVEGRKDLGLIAISYGSAYVAQISAAWKDTLTVKVFDEAESYPGTSLIIAYAPCIAHGYGFAQSLEQQKLAVDTGYWPVYRFDPRRVAAGQPGMKLESPAPKTPLEAFWHTQTRFQQVEPTRSHEILKMAQAEVKKKHAFYEQLAAGSVSLTSSVPPVAPVK